MRIFLAGATGVVGRRLVPRLIQAGHSVTAVSHSKAEELRSWGATPVELDLFDEPAVQRAVAAQDAVINLATRIPPANRAFFPASWRENDRIREQASWNLVRAALQGEVSRFIQESVTLGYADSGDEWISERTEWQPLPHVRSASEAERAAQHFTNEGRTGVVLRFALFYGPDSGHTLDIIRFAQRGIAASIGSPTGFISSIATDDAATAVVAALAAPAGTYNIGDDEPVRRREYFELLARALGRKMPWLAPAWLANLTGSVGKTLARSHRISNHTFSETTGWKPSIPGIREGWSRVVSSASRDGVS